MADESDEDVLQFLDALGDGFGGSFVKVPGDGYCFFSSIAAALGWSACKIGWKLYLLALFILLDQPDLTDFVSFPDGQEESARNRIAGVCTDLDVICLNVTQVYAIDKLLYLRAKRNVLDGPYWGDTPEMVALVRMLGIRLLVLPVPFQDSITVLAETVQWHSVDLIGLKDQVLSYDIVLLHRRQLHYDLLRVGNGAVSGRGCESWEDLVQQCEWRFLADLPAGPTQRIFAELKWQLCPAPLPSEHLESDPEGLPIGLDIESDVSDSAADSMSSCDGEDLRCYAYQVFGARGRRTDEDVVEEHVGKIASELRQRPLLPADPRDARHMTDWTDVGGIRLPLVHCAFKGCGWCSDNVQDLDGHLCRHHFRSLTGQNHVCLEDRNVCNHNMALYCAAIRLKEQEHMPLVGPSIDCRAIRQLHSVCEGSLTMLVCACCATKRIHLRGTRVSEIEQRLGADVWALGRDVLEVNFSMERFRRLYGHGPAFAEDTDLQAGNNWLRTLVTSEPGPRKMEILCCPEDVSHCGEHASHEVCSKCLIPICNECWGTMKQEIDYGVPMALCNDNFWGYMSAIVARHGVRFVEMCVALPVWTTTNVFYVENDRGHLLQEKIGQKRWRTAMRGYVSSFVMPWQDILQQLTSPLSDKDMAEIPRSPECLRFLVRFTLANELGPMLGQCRALFLRPGVVLLCLFELIKMGHEAFAGQGDAAEIRRRMESNVERWYPETEAHIPLEERQGHIPAGASVGGDAD